MKLVVVGSINMDYILSVSDLPKLGETLTAKGFAVAFGGKGANQAVACSRLGAQVSMIGSVGQDSIGDDLVNNLIKEGIDAKAVKRSEKKSGLAMITIDSKGDNTIVVSPGANIDLTVDDVINNADLIREADWMLVQLEIPIPAVFEAVKIAKESNTRVVMNPAPVKELPEDIFQYIDYITPNETELMKITKADNIDQGIEMLLEKGMKGVVVTLGEKGSMIITKDGKVTVDAFEFDSIDTTAAGDSFNAGFVMGMHENKEIKEILRNANILGGLATTKLGAQPSLPCKQDLEDYIEKLNL